MIGLSVIVLIVLYLFVSFKGVEYIYDKTHKKRYAVLATLFFILLPTWDVIIGKIYFDHLCKTDGGLKVYESVQADGFLDKSKTLLVRNKVQTSDIENAKRFLDYGFKFYEVIAHNGKIVHFSKDESGGVVYEMLDNAESVYVYNRSNDIFDSIILGVYHDEKKILGSSEEATGTYITYFRIGWLARVVRKYIGGVHAEYCPVKYTSLIEAVSKKINFKAGENNGK